MRWGDVDAARIIFYGAYIRFFEIAETELFRAVGLSYGRMFDELDIWLPRAHLECDFRSAAQLDDLLGSLRLRRAHRHKIFAAQF